MNCKHCEESMNLIMNEYEKSKMIEKERNDYAERFKKLFDEYKELEEKSLVKEIKYMK
jgi:hypothetical protein